MAGDLPFQPKAFSGRARTEGWLRLFSRYLLRASAVPPGVDRRYGRFNTRTNRLRLANYFLYPTERSRLVCWRSVDAGAATYPGPRPALRQRLCHQFHACRPARELDARIDK